MAYLKSYGALTAEEFHSRYGESDSPTKEDIHILLPNGQEVAISPTEIDPKTGKTIKLTTDEIQARVQAVVEPWEKAAARDTEEQLKRQGKPTIEGESYRFSPLRGDRKDSKTGITKPSKEYDSYSINFDDAEVQNPHTVQEVQDAIKDFSKVRYDEQGYNPDPTDIKFQGNRLIIWQELHDTADKPHIHFEVHRLPYVCDEAGNPARTGRLMNQSPTEIGTDKRVLNMLLQQRGLELDYDNSPKGRSVDRTEENEKTYVEKYKGEPELEETRQWVEEQQKEMGIAPEEEAPVQTLAEAPEAGEAPAAEQPEQKAVVIPNVMEPDQEYVKHLISRNAETEREITRLQKQSTLEMQMIDRLRTITAKENELKEVKKDLYNSEALREQAEVKAENLEQAVKELDDELQKEQRSHENIMAERDSIESSLRGEIGQLEESNQQLLNRTLELQGEKEDLQTKHDNLEQELAIASQQLEDDEKKIDKLTQQSLDKDDQISELRHEVKNRDTDINTLNQEKATLIQDKTNLEQQLEAERKQHEADLKQEQEKHTAEIQKLTEEAATVKEHYKETVLKHKQQMDEAQAIIQQQEKLLAEQKKTLEELQKKYGITPENSNQPEADKPEADKPDETKKQDNGAPPAQEVKPSNNTTGTNAPPPATDVRNIDPKQQNGNNALDKLDQKSNQPPAPPKPATPAQGGRKEDDDDRNKP